MKKIYIAGPDVFEKDALKRGKELVALCEKYGFVGLYPLDNRVDFKQPKHKIAQDIYEANVAMIQEADIVVANLNSFRGKEPDSGTVWECGYASALKKDVYVYMYDTADYKERFAPQEMVCEGELCYDTQGRLIEDFEYPLNLMIACSAREIVQGDFESVLKRLQK